MVSIQKTNKLSDLMIARGLLDSLNEYYPDFGYWYINKCVPGILTGTDLLLVAKDGPRLVGLAMGKLSQSETKLRCVRVLPEYQQKGTGIKLIEATLRAMNCDKPKCTVAEELIHQYSRVFINRLGFTVSAVTKGMYRKGKLEYVFNS